MYPRHDFDVVEYLKGNNSLLDSRLVSLQVSDAGEGAEMRLSFLSRKGASLRKFELNFSGEMECGFYFSPAFAFYNVEQVKFEVTRDGYFYLSLDPDLTIPGTSNKDQDFVKSRKVTLHEIPEE